MLKKNYIKWSWIGVLVALFQLNVAAQCDYDGFIVGDNGCNTGTIISNAATGDQYEVIEVLSYEAGTCIHFSFDEIIDNPTCPDYEKIELTCFEVTPIVPTACEAMFDHDQAGGEYTFYNLSSGDYFYSEWSFDGVAGFTNQDIAFQEFSEVGFHTVCLTIASLDGCFSTYCDDEIYFGAPEDICNYTDCVYPGDTDGDGFANVYDVLNIGVGYGAEGPERENDGVYWEASYSPSWDVSTINGLDYKHLDCNGDGWINEQDLQGIESNYVANDNVIEVTEAGAPQVWLEFTQDSIFLDENTPSFFTVEAKLMIATEGNPIEDLKGLALAIDYPEDLIEEGSPEFDYNDNSFFGNTNQIIWMPEDRPIEGKFDLGFVQKWEGANGNGEIGTLQIIIVGDVIAGRSETYMPLNLTLEGLTAISSNGAIKALGESEDAELTIVNNFTTGTNQEFISNKVHVFPNPAKDNLTIGLDDLTGERIVIYNAVGQEVIVQEVIGREINLDVRDLERGVHLVKIWTNEGVAVKKILIE